jgi:hypothetical protein
MSFLALMAARSPIANSAMIAAVGAVVVACAGAPAFAQTNGKIPELSSSTFDWTWVRIRADGRNALYGDGWLDPPAGLRGPIRNHPDHPLQGNVDRGPGRQVTLAIGNHLDPILKPWAAEQMRQSNEEVLSGKRGMPFLATSRCYPGSVPGQLLWTTEPFYFMQNPKKVHMVWQRDSLSRRISMTGKHSEHVKPSWYGESIGRYENGELVVDTIGLSTKMSFLDMFRTPHSEKLHVTERFKLTGNTSKPSSRSKTRTPSTNPCTWQRAGASRRASGGSSSAPRTIRTTTATTCSRCRKPKNPISDRELIAGHMLR